MDKKSPMSRATWHVSNGGRILDMIIPKGIKYKLFETRNFQWLLLDQPVNGRKIHRY